MIKTLKITLILLILLYSSQGFSQYFMRYEVGFKISPVIPWINQGGDCQYHNNVPPMSLYFEYNIFRFLSVGIERGFESSYLVVINEYENQTDYIYPEVYNDFFNLPLKLQAHLNKRLSAFTTLNNSICDISTSLHFLFGYGNTENNIYLMGAELGIEYKILRNLFLSISASRSNLLNTWELTYPVSINSDVSYDKRIESAIYDSFNPKLTGISLSISYGFGVKDI